MKYIIILLSIFFMFGCADPKSSNDDTMSIEETDLIDRVINVLTMFNLDDDRSCSFDQSTYNMFAIPHRFESGIETSRYIALNFTGKISIFGRGYNDRPIYKLLEITRLEEVFLTDPLKLIYNGFLGDNHGLIPGLDYYIVIEREEGFRLTTGCEGGKLPFGRKLASKDGGNSWIGRDNVSPWFVNSGVIRYTTD